MLSLIFSFVLAGTTGAQVQSSEKLLGYEGLNRERSIDPKKKGQEFSNQFIPVGHFYFVQFGIYPATTDPNVIRAPALPQVWLIFHQETIIKGKENTPGAYYIVKPFRSPAEAREAVKIYEKKGISCWYNAALNGTSFVLVRTTLDGFGTTSATRDEN